jgi:hypothetical protein
MTMSISEMITYSTVLISCSYKNGKSGTGTGFIIELCRDKENDSSVPVLVTNKHVANNSLRCTFDICRDDGSGNPIDKDIIHIDLNNASWIQHPNANVDLCCLPLAEVFNGLIKQGVSVFCIPLETNLISSQAQLDEIFPIEDILMVGYPIGLSNTINNKPVVRKGITATHIKKDYLEKPQFLIDCACYPGSSGSPVFIVNQGIVTPADKERPYMGNRVFLLGILYAGPQFQATGQIVFANLPVQPTPITNIPMNLGVVIKSSEIFTFEPIIKAMIGDLPQ